MPFSLEIVYQIWDDQHGSRVEVSLDRDSLGGVEVRSIADDGQVGPWAAMKPEQAALVAEEVLEHCARITGT